jgi:hypothetical protein
MESAQELCAKPDGHGSVEVLIDLWAALHKLDLRHGPRANV